MNGELNEKQLAIGRAVYRSYFASTDPWSVDAAWSLKSDSGKRFWVRLGESAVDESLRWNW